jgi:hypothetical protein
VPHRKASTAGSILVQSTGRRALLALAAVAASLLLTATAAQAAYTTGTPLTSLKRASAVAVNQETRDAYVARFGSLSLPTEAGGFAAFDFEGNSIAPLCELEKPGGEPPVHPGSVAVNESEGEAGNLYVLDLASPSSGTRVRTFPEACGEQISEFELVDSASRPVPRLDVDDEGNLYVPNTQSGNLERCTPTGTCTTLVEGLVRPSAVALDAAGNIFVAFDPSTSGKCTNVVEGRLIKYDSEGNEIEAFAGLDGSEPAKGEVSTVAIDRSTGDVFVGKGCGEAFLIEKYSPGGTKLDEFGSGVFGAGGNTTTQVIYNHLAVDETSGTVYAADTGHEAVQVFEDTTAKVPLTTAVTPTESGEVTCNDAPCKPEYDEGSEITAKGVPAEGYVFKEWTGGTGSAAACNGTSEPCTFFLEEASSLTAEFEEFVPSEYTLTVEPPAVGNVLSKDGKINCGKGVKCSAEYLEEEVVELEAAQPSGTHFTGWTGCEPPDGEASGRFCTLTMNADHTLGASYTSTHTLTVAKTGNPEAGGNVYSSPFGINCGNGSSCEAAFANETVVTLTAAVPAGSSFAGWKGPDAEAAGCGAATTCEVTMSEDLSLEAEYQKRYWLEVEVTSGGGPVGNVRSEPSALNCGKGSTCKVYFDAGTPVTLIASQGPGSHFESWTGCTPVGGQPRKCTLEMNENHEVTAAYE